MTLTSSSEGVVSHWIRHLKALRYWGKWLFNRVRRGYIRWRSGDLLLQKPDYALVSFPKCGRTWVRFMLARALQSHHGYALDHYYLLNSALYHRLTGKHLSIVHFAGHPHPEVRRVRAEDKAYFRDVHVVLLARDVRDTLISYYYHNSRRPKLSCYTLSEFIRLPYHGIEALVRYYQGWYQYRHVPRSFTLVHYEDVRYRTESTLREIVDMLGMEYLTDEAVRFGIQEGSFEKMRALEDAGQLEHYDLRFSKGAGDNPARRVRKGKVGGYRAELSAEDLAYIDSVVRASGLPLDWLYYPLEEAAPPAQS